MKKIFPFIFILFTCFGTSVFAKNQKITISGTEWIPYSGNSLPGKGLLTEITVKAFEAVGYTVIVKLIPWKRALINTKAGIFDGLLGASYSKERSKYFAYPKYAWQTAMHVFSNDPSRTQFTSFKNLCPAKVGILRGSIYKKQLSQPDCLNLEEGNQMEHNIRKLSKNRIQYMVESRDSIVFFLNQNPSYKQSIYIMTPPFEKNKAYTIISKKNPDYQLLVNRFDKGIQMIKKSGQYKAILKKHGF